MIRFTEMHIVLAKLHNAYPDSMTAIRGRISHLQKLGVGPSGVGKGQKIKYTFEDVMKFAFALEFAEFGVDPTSIKLIIDSTWDYVKQPLMAGGSKEQFLVVDPSIMTAGFANRMPGTGYILSIDDFQPSVMYRSMIVNLRYLHDRVVETLASVGQKP